jgi:hypothetical protein
VRSLQRAQAGVAGQERRCVCAARVRGKTPSRGAAVAGAAAGSRYPLLVYAGIVLAQAEFRAAGAVSGSAPMRSPADASPTSSRAPAHGSGSMWFAIPSSQWTCTTYSLPVSRRTGNYSDVGAGCGAGFCKYPA